MSATNNNHAEQSTEPCDEESIKGSFGWHSFDSEPIPYIYRQSEKYCSLRILISEVFLKHLKTAEICSSLQSYQMTAAEARLFNEINVVHCEGSFGPAVFTQMDRMVQLDAATKIHQLSAASHQKRILQPTVPPQFISGSAGVPIRVSPRLQQRTNRAHPASTNHSSATG